MSTTTLKQEVCERLDSLPPEDQRRVLDLARALGQRRIARVKGKDLLPFTKGFSKEDAEAVRQAIEEDFEKVDPSEW